MPSSTRIKGNALSLKFGLIDYQMDATSVVLDNEDADESTLTFSDAAESQGRQYFFTISAIQSLATASFWRYCWESTGTDVAFTYAPHGNAVATADQPHFIGTVTIGPRPAIGGEAGRTNNYTFDTRWEVVGVPSLDTGV